MRNIYNDGDIRPEEAKRQWPQEPTQPEPRPQLSDDQITVLLQQMLTTQPQPQPAAQPQPEARLEGLPEGVNTGTRIVFQSTDFEPKERPGTMTETEDFSLTETEPMTAATEAIGSFAVDEIDAAAREIPLPKPAPVTAPEGTALAVEELDIAQPGDEETHAKAKWKKILFIAAMVVCLIAIVGGGVWLAREHFAAKENDELSDELAQEEYTIARGTTMDAVGNVIELTDEQMWQQIREQHPNVTFPQNMQFKYANYYARNQDFVGYLEADGIGLSLPVVQTRNDGDYLYKNFDKQDTKYGCPFVSCLNRIDALDTNTVIYGHHMNNNTIFGTLDNYKSLDGYKKAPVIQFNTLYHDYSWKVFAVFITNSEPAEDGGYLFNYFFTNLASEEKRASYLNELAQRSIYDTGVDVLPSDKLLTLSTCSHEFNEARLVVVARLVRPGESTGVDTSRAVWNANPRYPQAWYDSKKKANPYASSPRWSVY